MPNTVEFGLRFLLTNVNVPTKDPSPTFFLFNITELGASQTLSSNSVVRKGSIIEDDVTIGCCSVIGSEGFQAIKGYRQKIKHVGICHIAKGANIGDNTTICNALFEGETYIGEYTNIDNHVQVAHNCKVGNNCVITASSIIEPFLTTEFGPIVTLLPIFTPVSITALSAISQFSPAIAGMSYLS